MDMGVYTIQVCQWVFEKEPVSITAHGTLNEDGVDVEMFAELDYGNDKKAHIRTSALKDYSNTVKITGTKGEITVRLRHN